jgi:putative membrane protein
MKLSMAALTFSCSLAILATPAFAANAKLTTQEREFITKASQGNIAEIMMGEMAKQKANDSGVRQFGNLMATDYSTFQSRLKTIAQKKGLTLPRTLDPQHAQTSKQLENLEGEAFDRTYMSNIIKDQDQDIKTYEQASKNIKEADIKNFAQKTLPLIRKHLKMAQDLNAKILSPKAKGKAKSK